MGCTPLGMRDRASNPESECSPRTLEGMPTQCRDRLGRGATGEALAPAQLPVPAREKGRSRASYKQAFSRKWARLLRTVHRLRPLTRKMAQRLRQCTCPGNVATACEPQIFALQAQHAGALRTVFPSETIGVSSLLSTDALAQYRCVGL
jgi:hypothetical protein